MWAQHWAGGKRPAGTLFFPTLVVPAGLWRNQMHVTLCTSAAPPGDYLSVTQART